MKVTYLVLCTNKQDPDPEHKRSENSPIFLVDLHPWEKWNNRQTNSWKNQINFTSYCRPVKLIYLITGLGNQ